jgi:hypothetical protein
MIDEKKLEALRESYLAGNLNIQYGPDMKQTMPLNELLVSLEFLWKVARAARRWDKASAGREAAAKAEELSELLAELPNAH